MIDTEQTTIELPGYIFLPAWLVEDVRTRRSPILAKGTVGEDWWVVYVEGETVTAMPEYEYPTPVLRLWDGSQVVYATAE